MDEDDVEIITQLYKDLCEASIEKDEVKLNEILAEDYVLVHMTGMHQTKKEYIDSVESGELKYFESIHETIDVRINGEKATVVGKTKTLASPFGMMKSWWRLRQDLELEKREGKWIITHSKASTY